MTDVPLDDETLDWNDMFENWDNMEPDDRLEMLDNVVNDEIDERFDISDDVDMYMGSIDPETVPEGADAPDVWYVGEGDPEHDPGIYFNEDTFGFMESDEALEAGLEGATAALQEHWGYPEVDMDEVMDEAAEWFEDITGDASPSRRNYFNPYGDEDEDGGS